MSGFGCRPSPAFLATALTRMGFVVYTTKAQPDFLDFHFEWKGDSAWRRDGHLLRRVFIASRTPIDNPHLELMQPTLQVITTQQVWLDVGAHLGEKTLSVASENPGIRVYAFEPNLSVASQLMGQLSNYVVLPIAVAEQDGSAPFYLNRFDAASSLLPFVREGLDQWIGGEVLAVESTLIVPTIRLDRFLNQAGIAKVAYLKIDAQGSDLAVIRSLGDRLRDVDRITLEVQTTPVPLYQDASSKEETVRFLARAGFVLTSCEKQSHGQEENLTFVLSQ